MPFPSRISRSFFVALPLGLVALAASTVMAAPASADVEPAGSVLQTAGTVLKAAGSAVAAQSSAHITFSAVSSSSALDEKIVADLGTKSGTEKLTEGAAVLSVRVTPSGGYISGSSTGLTSLFGMSATQAKTVGTKWEAWKPGTSEYTNLKSDVTVASLTSLLPKAKGITVSTRASNGDKRYVLAWTTAATGNTPKLSNTLSLSATKANLPIEETSTGADGVKVTTKISKWGEPVAVRAPVGELHHRFLQGQRLSHTAGPSPGAGPPRIAKPPPGAGRRGEAGTEEEAATVGAGVAFPGWLTLLGWIGIGLLAIVALMRIFAWDDLEPFALLNTFSLLVYLPAWIVAIVAAAGRRYLLAAAAVLVVAAQLTFVLPELTAAQPAPRWAARAPTIRLFDANVYYLNPSMAGYAREIQRYKPQLVTMEEATTQDARMLEHSSALRALPYRIDIAREDPKAFFIASAYPLHEERVIYSGGVPLIVEAIIELPSGPQALWVVHTDAPITDSFTLWKSQLTLIARLVRAHGTSKLLVVGDFNATWGSKGFREILGDGMIDGATARGRALDMTWSQTKVPLPPFVRIDHVLTGPGVTVTSITTGDGPGSDHRDLMATVAVRR